ncbi:MAG: hypothetical protein Q7T33_01960 [Dehalococcoidia bacterium]|nr:hypothetical protein [Dehalococcoidia bacterium]
MQIVFRLAYSLAVAILFVLFVILGTRTFYSEPEYPRYPEPSRFPVVEKPPLQSCDFQSGFCYDPKTDAQISVEEARRLYPAELAAQEEAWVAQQEYETKVQKYLDDRADYHRVVFIVASLLGVLAVAVALYLFGKVEAMPLGLILGGIGVIIFGWVDAAEDFDEIGMAPLFIVVAIGLGAVLAAGYRFLGAREAAGAKEG